MITSRRVLAGRYRMLGPLGEGGMAIVHRAHDEVLGRDVAIKLLRPAFADDPEFVRRFRREAQHAASLRDPHIVTIHDLGVDPVSGADYIVMELVDGITLEALLAHRPHLPLGQALRIAEETAEALQVAHDHGIVHRDVKPGNILLDRDGSVRVADFGIARAAGEGAATTSGVVIGSPQYVSPEQVAGASVTAASDIYSLGVVLYEMVTAQRPFEGASAAVVALQRLRVDPQPPSTVADVPPALDDIVLRALARGPQDRYPSAAEMAVAIDGFRLHHLGGVRRSGAGPRAVRDADATTADTAPLSVPVPISGRRGGTRVPASVAGDRGNVGTRGGEMVAGEGAVAAPETVDDDSTPRRSRRGRAAPEPGRNRSRRGAAAAEAAKVSAAESPTTAGAAAAGGLAAAAAAPPPPESTPGNERPDPDPGANRRPDSKSESRNEPATAARAPAGAVLHRVEPASPRRSTGRPRTTAADGPRGNTDHVSRRRRRRAVPPLISLMPLIVLGIVAAFALAALGLSRGGSAASASPTAGAAALPKTSPSAFAAGAASAAPPSPEASPSVGRSPVPPAQAVPAPTAAATPRVTPRPTPKPTARPTPRPTTQPGGVNPSTNPAETVRRFYALVAAHRFDEAARLWSPRMRRQYPPAGYIDGRFARTTAIDIRRLEIRSESTSRGTATVFVDLVEYRRDEAPRRYVGTWDLVRSSGVWLMDQPHF